MRWATDLKSRSLALGMLKAARVKLYESSFWLRTQADVCRDPDNKHVALVE